MRKYWFISLVLFGICTPELFAQTEIDSVKTVLDSATDPLVKLRATNYLSELYWEVNPNETIKYGTAALQMAKDQSNEEQLSHAYLNLCQGHLYKDEYADALDFGLKSLEIRQRSTDLPDLAFILRTIGWLYYDMQNSDMALKYHKETLLLYERIGDQDRIGNSLNALGLVYSQKRNFQTALLHFERALEIVESLKLKAMVAVVLSNMGKCYQELGNNDIALNYLERSLAINQELEDVDLFVVSLNRIGKAYLDLKNYGKAEQILDSAVRMMEVSHMTEKKVLMMENLMSRSILYATKQDFKKSLEAMNKHNELRDEILSEEKSYELMELRVGYEQEKRETEIKLLEQEQELLNIRRNMLIGGLTGLLLITILLVGRLRSSYRKNKLILETKQALTNAELEKSKITRDRLKNELDFKNKELTTFGMHIAQKNELFNEFIESLTHIEQGNFDQEHVNDRIKSFTKRLEINHDLEEFYSHTELVHQDFLFKLQEKFPELTDHEKKLSSQIRLNLSNKEIAAMNNISLKSVEVGRSRLRKKMGLDGAVNFSEFLQNI